MSHITICRYMTQQDSRTTLISRKVSNLEETTLPHRLQHLSFTDNVANAPARTTGASPATRASKSELETGLVEVGQLCTRKFVFVGHSQDKGAFEAVARDAPMLEDVRLVFEDCDHSEKVDDYEAHVE